nr:putative esterase [Sporomusa silvacetica DSM 10669]
MKRVLLTLMAFLMLVMTINSLTFAAEGIDVQITDALGDKPMTTENVKHKHIKSVTAITEVFGDGQKVTAVAVECDKEIDNSKLTESTFSVNGRTITKVYANTAAAKAALGVNGKYAIIELSTADEGALTFVPIFGETPKIAEAKVSVTQLGEIITTDGEKYTPDSNAVVNDQVINLVVDDFKQIEYKDPKTGKTLKYNLFVPNNYDKNKSYPMVLFIHDAGVTSTETKATLIQGLGAVIWATPSEQAKHECFVLAPQYASATVNDNSETTDDLDTTVSLINSLESQYKIDKNRLYTTGQSMGCMSSIALNIKYPNLFAASLLVAGQWDPTVVAPLVKDKLWIIVSEGDVKAFPGMNAITATLEKAGAKISRATWNGQLSAAEFASDVSKMIAEGKSIKYTVLKKGTVVPADQIDDGGNNHRYTWRIAYTIEGVRDWLFTQERSPKL